MSIVTPSPCEQAIQRNSAGGSEVYVVSESGRVAVQPVQTGSEQAGFWFITAGLKSGDRVIVKLSEIGPGDQVRSQSWNEAGAAVD